MSRGRHRFTKSERERIWNADAIPLTGGRYALCRYCNLPVRRDEDWHVAHEIAYSKWPKLFSSLGRDKLWNVGVAHSACNIRAGDAPMTFWQSISLRWKLRIVAALVVVAGVVLASLLFA